MRHYHFSRLACAGTGAGFGLATVSSVLDESDSAFTVLRLKEPTNLGGVPRHVQANLKCALPPAAVSAVLTESDLAAFAARAFAVPKPRISLKDRSGYLAAILAATSAQARRKSSSHVFFAGSF